MSAISNWLRSAIQTIAPGAGRRPTPKKRVSLWLETLEDRAVPTVAFTPHFFGTNWTPPSGETRAQEQAASLKSPAVVLIFAGSDWTTTQGKTNQQTALSSIQSILGSNYLDALDQYGSDGKAVFFSSWQTNSTPTLTGNTPTDSDLRTFINNQIATQKKNNASLVPGSTAIYFVISDPKDSGTASGTFGFNSSNGSAVHIAFVGAKAFKSGSLEKDVFTQVFSHELAEAMAPAIHVNDPGSLNEGFQIADGEPENFGFGYAYRLKGNRVQAYWSQRDGAWIVPDGNSQVFTLSWSAATFDNTFNLDVLGDQLGTNFNDTITLDRDPVTTGARVTLNNQQASFDVGILKQISLLTKGGANTVNVKSVQFGESVYVDSGSDSSNDTVVVGNNGSLGDIGGYLNVANSSGGKTALQIETWADGPSNITITDHSIGVLGLATINYTPYSGPSSKVNGVMSVTIDDASGENFINAQSVPAYVPITVNGNISDFLYGPAANKVKLVRFHYIGNAGGY
jgi:hypothetical protein